LRLCSRSHQVGVQVSGDPVVAMTAQTKRTLIVAIMLTIIATALVGCGTSHYWPKESKIDTPSEASAPPNCTITHNKDGTVDSYCRP
jgi:hypothetical protein